MTGTNFYTQSTINSNVWIKFATTEGLVDDCELRGTTTLPTEADMFSQGCTLKVKSTGNLFINNAADGLAPIWNSFGLETVQIHLTSAEILALNTTPKVLVPAQGPNTVIDIISVSGSMDFVTSQYTLHTNIEILEGGNALWSNSNLLPAVSDTTRIFNQNGGATMVPNTPLTATVTGGNPVGGQGSLDLYVTYKVYTRAQ